MNLRFIIFVVITSLSLFFVNQYFVPDPKETSSNEQASAAVVDKLPSIGIGTLPLFPLYSTDSSSDAISYGLEVGKGTYMLPTGALPEEKETLFVKNNKGLIKKVNLINKDLSKEKCLIYSEQAKPLIKTLSLPAGKSFLTLLQIEETAPFAYPAMINNGKLTLGKEKPSSNCLVIYDDLGEFFVLGIYDASYEQIIPFSSIGSLDSLIDYVPMQVQKNVVHNEQLYVLENETMQLVFSNLGGSICEVNLPIKSSQHPHSVILSVDEDALIAKQAPLSNLFPLSVYKESVDGKITQFEPKEGGYYPLLRRGIAKKDRRAITRVLPKFYAASVTEGNNDELASIPYKLKSISSKRIVFSAQHAGRRITKTFELPKNGKDAPYVLLANVEVEGNNTDLYFNSGVPEVEFVSGRPSPAITYISYNGSDLSTGQIKLPKTVSTLEHITPDWVANSNGYFATIIDPLDKVGAGVVSTYVPGEVDPSRITLIDVLSDRYPASKYPGYQIAIPLSTKSNSTDFRLYLGPLDAAVLKKVDAFYTNQVTGYSPEYNKAITYQGFFSTIIEPFARLLSILIGFCYKFSHSWGLSIILLTLLLRLILYPLNAWSIKSTIGMKLAEPELKKMQAKYKNDPLKTRTETMRIYKEYNVNPLGCIVPLFLQAPFLFGIFSVLKTNFAIRGASFIPGWINNLSSPDSLFSWSTSIPFIGTSFHLLPLIAALLMFLQTKQSSKGNDTSNMSDMQKQQQKMNFIMPVLMLVIFYKMPSGLNIYFISSSVLQMVQHSITLKSIQKRALKKNPKEVLVKTKRK
ncbi:hypothetical protein COB21_00305 [Candidatus Aerophobetes bacterium]|uniref:Membrane protein insertase YidC n=1 Tax=Aerophobetes bacterium TaxID=2030807 RepID=A0A2A4X9D3_UNCAE|nr:MAG: hypothetical protein COB21_00305 [Candidatus Aerophobetes bacterium]